MLTLKGLRWRDSSAAPRSEVLIFPTGLDLALLLLDRQFQFGPLA